MVCEIENDWKRIDYMEPYSGLNTETIENEQKRLKTDSGIGESNWKTIKTIGHVFLESRTIGNVEITGNRILD